MIVHTSWLKQVEEGDGLVFTKIPGNLSVSLGISILLECAVSDPSADVMWSVCQVTDPTDKFSS